MLSNQPLILDGELDSQVRLVLQDHLSVHYVFRSLSKLSVGSVRSDLKMMYCAKWTSPNEVVLPIVRGQGMPVLA